MRFGQPAYTAFEVDIVRLSTKDPLSWALMPQLRARALDFAISLGQTGVDDLVKRLDQGFVQDSDAMAVWMVVRKADGTLVGHLIAQDDHFGGHPVGFVLQLLADRLSKATIDTIVAEMDAWSRARAHTRILMVTKRFHFRAWWKMFGFKIFRAIMTREL